MVSDSKEITDHVVILQLLLLQAQHVLALNLAHAQLGHVVQDVAALRVKVVRLGIGKAEGAQAVAVRRYQRCSAVEAHRRVAIHKWVVLEPGTYSKRALPVNVTCTINDYKPALTDEA